MIHRSQVLIVNNGTLSLEQLRTRFENLHSDTIIADITSLPKKINGKYCALVLSGTKVRAYDLDFYRPLIDLIIGSKIPVLGICGGMQLLAVAAGAALTPGPQRVGSYVVTVDKTNEPLFKFVENEVTLFHRHTLYLHNAPCGYQIIGSSKEAPVEFIRSDDGRIYGSQAHLEFRSDGTKILQGFTQLYS